MTQWVKEAIEQIKVGGREPYCVLGFSYGAMIALISASMGVRPGRLFLCSLSPYFSEFLSKDRRKLERAIGKKRAMDFSGIRYKNVLQGVRATTELFVGGSEAADVLKIARMTRRSIASSKLHVVENALHDIGDKRYQAAVVARIKS
jgi:hypothetical protein